MEIAIVLIEILLIITLVIYIKHIKEKYQTISKSKEKLENLSILKKLINVAAENKKSTDKIVDINKIILENFNITYSSIVMFDGKKFNVLTSNVSKNLYKNIENYYTAEVFEKAVAQGVTVKLEAASNLEKFSHLGQEFDRVKSTIFLPMFSEKVFIGYIVLEHKNFDGLKNFDINLLNMVRDVVLDVVKSISYQASFENLVSIDKFTSLKSREYLFAEGERIIRSHSKSTITMLKVENLQQINDECSREVGNNTLTKIAEVIERNVSDEYIKVRYMGPKFVIVFPGVVPNSIDIFLKQFKEKLESIRVTTLTGKQMFPKILIASGIYYNGTLIDSVTRKLEKQIDEKNNNGEEITVI